jgi:hypothetical protein
VATPKKATGAFPYSRSTSGKQAIDEIARILQGFGCKSFGHMMDFAEGELLVQFEYRGHRVTAKASARGWAAAWLKKHPWTSARSIAKSVYEQRAVDQGAIAVHSVLRDWIKGQITAIECGALTFEAAFLAQIMLPDGRSVLERVEGEKIVQRLA